MPRKSVNRSKSQIHNDIQKLDVLSNGLSNSDLLEIRSEQEKLLLLLDENDPRVKAQRRRISQLLTRIGRSKDSILEEHAAASRDLESDFTLLSDREPLEDRKFNPLPLETPNGEVQGPVTYFRTGGPGCYFSPWSEIPYVESRGENDWWGFRGISTDSKSETFSLISSWYGDLDKSRHYVLNNNIYGNLRVSFDFSLDGTIDNLPYHGSELRVIYEVGFGRVDPDPTKWVAQPPLTSYTLMDYGTYLFRRSGHVSNWLFYPFPLCSHISLIPSKYARSEVVGYVARVKLTVYLIVNHGGSGRVSNLSFGYTSSDIQKDVWLTECAPQS